MANIIGNVQEKFKTSTNALAMLTARLLSGMLVGLTLSLIGQEIIRYGWISFMLVIIVVTACLLKISKTWSWTHLLIFNLICVLIALCLRMYILIAPTA